MNNEISKLLKDFEALSGEHRQEALETMEHMYKYENMTVWEYQNKVFEMSGKLDRLNNLFEILSNCYFEWDKSTLENDRLEREMFVRSYSKIKSLVHAMWDIAGNVAEVADALSIANIRKS